MVVQTQMPGIIVCLLVLTMALVNIYMVVLILIMLSLIPILHLMMVLFTLIIYGCTNPVAANYDEFATVDDDSCTVEIDLLEVCNPYCENDFGSVTFE